MFFLFRKVRVLKCLIRDGLVALKVFHLSEKFNMLHINCTHGVGGDRPACVWQGRVIVPSPDSVVCFPSWEMIGDDKTNL